MTWLSYLFFWLHHLHHIQAFQIDIKILGQGVLSPKLVNQLRELLLEYIPIHTNLKCYCFLFCVLVLPQCLLD